MIAAERRLVWLDGRLRRAADAVVSIDDRGFLYGDGIFETLRVYRGEVFAPSAHLERLRGAAAALAITLPDLDWRECIRRLLAANQAASDDAWLRITVTRGRGSRGLLPTPTSSATVLLSCGALDARFAGQRRRGIRATVLPFGRHPWFANLKSANYLDGILGRIAADRAGADEGFFVDARGRVTEGTVSNLFVVRGAILQTPPLGAILPGVTRGVVLELARQQGWRVQERRLTVAAVRAADECFVTSSLAEIVPVTTIDDLAVGDGRVGDRTRDLQRRYRALVRRRRQRDAVSAATISRRSSLP